MVPSFDSKQIEEFRFHQQPKPGRRVIWDSYSKGTYIKAIHGLIGSSNKTSVN